MNAHTVPSVDFVPAWAKRAIWYQIFPERFWNGDPRNDPNLASQQNSWPHDTTEPWQPHPWTTAWYALEPYEQAHAQRPIWHHLQRRRYGGDLQGIIDRLDYLQDLGVNAIYLNPVFTAPSAHKYDGATYHHVDPYLGPDPAGDIRLAAGENPGDSQTWVWTEADRLLLHLVGELHRRGMRIILDGVFNHMGLNSWAFQDVVRNGQASPYREWFKITDWNIPSQFAPFSYRGWFGTPELPELNQDENGITAGPREYIFAATRRWLDPDADGHAGDGIDGWRLDVAFCIRHGFWKAFRQHVKALNPEAYLVAEIINEDDNAAYLQGDEFDAVMNYKWTFTCAEFFLQSRSKIDAAEFDRRLEAERAAYPPGVAYGMQNLLDSHDTARIASFIVNRQQLNFRDWAEYNQLSRVAQNPAFDTRPPTEEERQLQQLLLLFQFADVGAPMIYYGDEAGMWGANDPCCRKPMVWPGMVYAPEAPSNAVTFNHKLHQRYKQLVALRNSLPALQLGAFTTLYAEGSLYAFERAYERQRVIVALNNSRAVQRLQLPAAALNATGEWRDRLDNDHIYSAGPTGLTLHLAPLWGVVLEPKS
jgi:glycosidase